MRKRAISWRFLAFGGNVMVCLLLMVLLFGCKDKAEEVGSEQQKKEAGATGVRTVELTLYPAKIPEPAQKYQLLPKAADQIDADAAPLYEKALQALPKNFQTEQISQWLKTTPEKLPLKQVQSTLQQFNPTMELLKQAAKCKQCDWPYLDDDTYSQNLREYRNLAFFLALQVRVQIAQGQYDKAIGTVQTGFAMVKHLSNAPDLAQSLVGFGISELICRQLELFVQRPDTPNLYLALRGLPQPFIDLTEQLEMYEQDTQEKIRPQMNRSNRHVVALQCIEAIRLYTAIHNGKFPNELSDITQVPVPVDPVTQKPLVYQRTGSKAFLEAPAAKGTADKYTFRYELSLKE
jgi:tetratricopeptide (TPR) repeat protein